MDLPGAANHVSLRTAQKNYEAFGAAERRTASEARDPVPGEARENQWRPVDPGKDSIEEPARGVDYAESYPEDTTELYYWRPTYWRRIVG